MRCSIFKRELSSPSLSAPSLTIQTPQHRPGGAEQPTQLHRHTAAQRRVQGVREREPVLAAAASGQAKHHPVYPGASTVRGAIGDRLAGPWNLTEYALL